MEKNRCSWCLGHDIYVDYHDHEWGVPVHDDRLLFEMLILEGAQAGLSWLTVLRKRENYQVAFDHFDPRVIANYGPDKIEELLNNAGIVRNKLKVNGTVKNAKAFLKVVEEFGSFDAFIWTFVGGEPIHNSYTSMQEVPAFTPESDAMSKALRKRGFTFVGSTICYAYMQATGMVNDHLTNCYRYSELNS